MSVVVSLTRRAALLIRIKNFFRRTTYSLASLFWSSKGFSVERNFIGEGEASIVLYENRKKMLMNIEKRIFNIFEGKLKNKQGCLLKHTVRQNSILVLKFNWHLKKTGNLILWTQFEQGFWIQKQKLWNFELLPRKLSKSSKIKVRTKFDISKWKRVVKNKFQPKKTHMHLYFYAHPQF